MQTRLFFTAWKKEWKFQNLGYGMKPLICCKLRLNNSGVAREEKWNWPLTDLYTNYFSWNLQYEILGHVGDYSLLHVYGSTQWWRNTVSKSNCYAKAPDGRPSEHVTMKYKVQIIIISVTTVAENFSRSLGTVYRNSVGRHRPTHKTRKILWNKLWAFSFKLCYCCCRKALKYTEIIINTNTKIKLQNIPRKNPALSSWKFYPH